MGALDSIDAEAEARIRCARNGPPRIVAWGTPYSRLPEVCTLFVHGRRAPGGDERLVVVEFNAGEFVAGDPAPFKVRLFRPAGPLSWWRCGQTRAALDVPCPATEPLRLYFGEPDPTDASHFTIQYSIGDRRGLLDGWLRSDGTVSLITRPTSTDSR